MAIARIDDTTGEPGAEPVVIDIAGQRWRLDLVDASVKGLLEAVRPWTDRATPLAYDVEEGGEGLPLAEAPPVSAPPAAAAGAGSEAAPVVELTPDERAQCRAWAAKAPQRVLNKYGADRPAARGSLSRNVIAAWEGEGRPE